MSQPAPISSRYAECISACQECATACEQCISAYLNEPDVEAVRHCIELCHSCARICSLAVEEMAFGSGFVVQICGLCAVIARSCAEECRDHGSEHCQSCVEASLRCAQECHVIATASTSNPVRPRAKLLRMRPVPRKRAVRSRLR